MGWCIEESPSKNIIEAVDKVVRVLLGSVNHWNITKTWILSQSSAKYTDLSAKSITHLPPPHFTKPLKHSPALGSNSRLDTISPSNISSQDNKFSSPIKEEFCLHLWGKKAITLLTSVLNQTRAISHRISPNNWLENYFRKFIWKYQSW